MSVIYRKYGFQNILTAKDFAPGEKFAFLERLADPELLAQMGNNLQYFPHPFFAFIETVRSHAPYKDLPPKYRTLMLGHYVGTMLGNYLHYIHYLDAALGRFYGRLQELGLLSSSILALYGVIELTYL